MPRGVKLGANRGNYKRFNKAKLHKLARDILAGNIDREAVADAFMSTNRLPDRLIADQLRSGAQLELRRLARAVENLADKQKRFKITNMLPLWMAKAALRHLSQDYGGDGEALHKALKVEYPYGEHPKVRAYHRQLARDYGPRSKSVIETQLNDNWPQRKPGRHPELEKAIRESLSGHRVPLQVWRSVSRKRTVK